MMKNVLIIFVSLLLCIVGFESFLMIRGYPIVYRKYLYPPLISKKIKSNEYTYSFSTNGFGLREKNISLKKKKGQKRVFITGDSFVEGVGVDNDKTITSILTKKYKDKNIQFINGGKAGGGPFLYGRIILGVGLKYNPDAVIMCVYANDISNTYWKQVPDSMYVSEKNLSFIQYIIPRTFVLYKWATKPSKTVYNKNVILDIAIKAKSLGYDFDKFNSWYENIPQELFDAANKKELNTQMIENGLIRPYYWKNAIDIDTVETWGYMVSVMAEAINVCKSKKIKFGLVYIPSPLQYDTSICIYNGKNLYETLGYIIDKNWITQTSNIQTALYNFAKIIDVPFLDATPHFRNYVKKHGSINYNIDSHLTESGNNLLANILSIWIEKEKLY